jgi:hypothetical protein
MLLRQTHLHRCSYSRSCTLAVGEYRPDLYARDANRADRNIQKVVARNQRITTITQRHLRCDRYSDAGEDTPVPSSGRSHGNITLIVRGESSLEIDIPAEAAAELSAELVVELATGPQLDVFRSPGCYKNNRKSHI